MPSARARLAFVSPARQLAGVAARIAAAVHKEFDAPVSRALSELGV